MSKFDEILAKYNSQSPKHVRFGDFYLQFAEPETIEANGLLLYDFGYLYDFMFCCEKIQELDDKQTLAVLYNAVMSDEKINILLRKHILQNIKVKTSEDDTAPTSALSTFTMLKVGKPTFLATCLQAFLEYIYFLDLGERLIVFNAGLSTSNVLSVLNNYRNDTLGFNEVTYKAEFERLTKLAQLVVGTVNKTAEGS